MGRATTSLVNTVTLNCAPLDMTSDGQINANDVQVTDGNQSPIIDFTVNGSNLIFGSNLPTGLNTITYFCVQ